MKQPLSLQALQTISEQMLRELEKTEEKQQQWTREIVENAYRFESFEKIKKERTFKS